MNMTRAIAKHFLIAGCLAVLSYGQSGTQTPGTWRNVSPRTLVHPEGFICFIGVDPVRPSDVYCSGKDGIAGTWKSTDYGLNFVKVSTGVLGDKINGCGAGDIEHNRHRDPSTPPTLFHDSFIGSLGVYKSTNGGVDWTNIWNNNIFAPDGITNISSDVGSDVSFTYVLDTTNATHLLAALHGYGGTGGNNGVFESTNGGATWIVHKATEFSFQPHNDVLSVLDEKTWLVSWGTISPNPFLYRTTNCGASWSLVSTTLGKNIGHSMCRVGSTVYSGAEDGVYKTTNNGASWTKLAGSHHATSISATADTLYATYGPYDNSGLEYYHAAIANDNIWMTGPTPTGMTSGADQSTSTFDGTNHIVVASCWVDGIWRYVEPAKTTGIKNRAANANVSGNRNRVQTRIDRKSVV
jgi:hypothetical protein